MKKSNILLIGLMIFGVDVAASEKISKEEADRLASIFFEPRGELRNPEPVVTKSESVATMSEPRTLSSSQRNIFGSRLSPVRKQATSMSSLMTVSSEADDFATEVNMPVKQTKLPAKFRHLLQKSKNKTENPKTVIPYIPAIEALRKKSPCQHMPTVKEEFETESQLLSCAADQASLSSFGANSSHDVYTLSNGLFGKNQKTLRDRVQEAVFTNNIIAFNNVCENNDITSIKLDEEELKMAREFGFSPSTVNSLDPEYKKSSGIIGFVSGFLDRSKSKSVSPYSLIDSNEQEVFKTQIGSLSRKASPASVVSRFGSPSPKAFNSSLPRINENNFDNPDLQSEDC